MPLYAHEDKHNFQGLFCVRAQPMRDDVTLQRRLSLAGRMHKMIPEFCYQICEWMKNRHCFPCMSRLYSSYVYDYGYKRNGV